MAPAINRTKYYNKTVTHELIEHHSIQNRFAANKNLKNNENSIMLKIHKIRVYFVYLCDTWEKDFEAEILIFIHFLGLND